MYSGKQSVLSKRIPRIQYLKLISTWNLISVSHQCQSGREILKEQTEKWSVFVEMSVF